MYMTITGKVLKGMQAIAGKEYPSGKLVLPIFQIKCEDIYSEFDKQIKSGYLKYSSSDISFMQRDTDKIKHADAKGYVGYANKMEDLDKKSRIIKRPDELGGDKKVQLSDELNVYLGKMFDVYRPAAVREIIMHTINSVQAVTQNAKAAMIGTNYSPLGIGKYLCDDHEMLLTELFLEVKKMDAALKPHNLGSRALTKPKPKESNGDDGVVS